MTYKTSGIILRRRNLGEADRIVVIFSEKYGLIRAKARGVRWTKSKLAGHLEPFCLTNLVMAEGKNLDTIIGADLINSYPKIRANLNRTNQAYYLAEIIDRLMAEKATHRDVFELLKQGLEILNNNQEFSSFLPFFELKIAAISGFEPQLDHCVEGKEKLSEKNNFFSAKEGGIICSAHSKNDGNLFNISAATIKLMRIILTKNYNYFFKIRIPDKIKKELGKITRYYLKYIMEKELNSERFLS